MEFQMGQIIALTGAVLAVLMGGIGSALAVGRAGETSAGVTSENPDLFGKCLVLQLLPGTQGVYGFLIGFIVLIKTQFLGGMIDLSVAQGMLIFAGCMPVAIVGFTSAIYQGRVASSAMNMVALRPDQSGKGITMAVMVETYAVLSLLASFLMVWFVAI